MEIFKAAFCISASIVGLLLGCFIVVFSFIGIATLVMKHLPNKLKPRSDNIKITIILAIISFCISAIMLLNNKKPLTWECIYVFVATFIISVLVYDLALIHHSRWFKQIGGTLNDSKFGIAGVIVAYSLFLGTYLFSVLVIFLSLVRFLP